jgi:DNA repair protein RecO (recombination protein O)
MDWTDDGIVLSARKHGESAAIASLLTRGHGRHTGLVRGGNSRRQRGVLQTGNMVRAAWRARLEEHLGTYSVELVEGHAARVMDDPGRLAAMAAACALVDMVLPEREAHPNLFESLGALLGTLIEEAWAEAYVIWELTLLAELGFGLDLTECAATGATDELIYVSPKSGRAVSADAGEPYRDKLLPLPAFLLSPATAETGTLSDGLRLTGYFLDRHVLTPHDKSLPDARQRLAERFGRRDS